MSRGGVECDGTKLATWPVYQTQDIQAMWANEVRKIVCSKGFRFNKSRVLHLIRPEYISKFWKLNLFARLSAFHLSTKSFDVLIQPLSWCLHDPCFLFGLFVQSTSFFFFFCFSFGYEGCALIQVKQYSSCLLPPPPTPHLSPIVC